MARITRDTRIETREARTKLKIQHAPYWRQIHQGLSIGYRKGKRGGVWLVRRLIDGEYSFDRLGSTDDRQDANGIDVLEYRQAHRKAIEVSDAKVQPDFDDSYTVEEAMDDYLEWLALHRKSAKASEYAIKAHIKPKLGKKRVVSLTTKDIRKWQHALAQVADGNEEAQRKRKSTANRILTILKAGLNHIWREGIVPSDDAWRRIKAFKGVDESRKIFLSHEQCTRLINISQGALRTLVQAALYTGARPGKELSSPKVRDFDPSQGVLHIPDGKTGSRDVYLTDEGVLFFNRVVAGRHPDEILLLKEDGAPWEKSHHIRPMKEAVKQAELPEESNFYTLRHTYISMALKNGMNIKVLADSCGTSIRMIEKHYAKFLNEDRRKMFNQAIPSFGYVADNIESFS